jgi:hypothetical protein
VLISSILFVTAASNALHRRTIVRYFNTHAIKADYSGNRQAAHRA